MVKLCKKFANKYPTAVDRELLLNAAWLHDVAKLSAGKKHNKRRKVSAVLKKHNLYHNIDHIKRVTRIIKSHKGKKFNPQKYKLESAVVRLCDKLDRFKKGKKDADKKCRKTLKKAKDVLEEKDYQILEEFYENRRNTIINKETDSHLLL